MLPMRGYFGQWQQNKGPILHSGMRQDEFRRVFDPSVVVDDIEVKRSGSVGDRPLPPELRLDPPQQTQPPQTPPRTPPPPPPPPHRPQPPPPHPPPPLPP